MQTDWSNCTKCSLHSNRKGMSKPTMGNSGLGQPHPRILLLLSEDKYSDTESRFFKKILSNASEAKLDQFDLSVVNVVGCPRPSWKLDKASPFKTMCGLTSKQVSSCRDRVLYLIDQIDPDIIIASGLPAAKALGVITGQTRFFTSEAPREVEIRGHLIKVPRVIMVLPTIKWLAKNISMDKEGPTAKAVRTLRIAVQYSTLKQKLIGDRDVE